MSRLASHVICSYIDTDFQWDAERSASNEAKYGVTFLSSGPDLQAAQIFRRPFLKRQDTRRDYGETRFIALGAFDGDVLRVVFTERDGDIRLISAWRAGKHDRENYKAIHGGAL